MRFTEPFIQIPARAAETLSAGAFRLLCLILMSVKSKGKGTVDWRTLRKYMSNDAISRGKKELIEKGWLIQKRNFNASNFYTIAVPEIGAAAIPETGAACSGKQESIDKEVISAEKAFPVDRDAFSFQNHIWALVKPMFLQVAFSGLALKDHTRISERLENKLKRGPIRHIRHWCNSDAEVTAWMDAMIELYAKVKEPIKNSRASTPHEFATQWERWCHMVEAFIEYKKANAKVIEFSEDSAA